MCVFPGGGVDPRDFDPEIGWVGPVAGGVGRLLGTDEAHRAGAGVRGGAGDVRGVRRAAGRADRGHRRRGHHRRRLGGGPAAPRGAELSFTEFLDRRGLVLRTDLLRLWGSWMTPVFEPRRYDTRFFVAELPAGRCTRDVSTESDQVVWMPVREAIDAVDEQRDADAAADVLHAAWRSYELRDPGRGAGRGRRPGPDAGRAGRQVLDDEGAYLSIPRPAGPARRGRRGPAAAMTPGPAGRSGSGPACVLAPNPSMMTLDGTNTWVLREPGAPPVRRGRPGPLDEAPPRRGRRRAPVRSPSCCSPTATPTTARRRGRSPSGWAAASARWTRSTGSATRASATATWSRSTASRCTSSAPPATPSDSLSFVLPAERAVLTGDTVLGRGTTVVAHPDGQLGAYLDSLHRLHALAEAQEVTAVWPGHGPVIDDALGALDYYLAHRRERLEQVREAAGVLGEPSATTPRGRGAGVRRRRPGALGRRRAVSVRAQLDYLRGACRSG